jgi:hypothetical protein
MIATAPILRDLGDIGRNPARLILGEQSSCRSPFRISFIVDVAECLPIGIAYDEGGAIIFNFPPTAESDESLLTLDAPGRPVRGRIR